MTLAIIFPGQGSQQLGMLSDFEAQYPLVKETFSIASKVLGYDLWDICQHQAELLNQTSYTQPALLCTNYVYWQLLQTASIQPSYLAGHSLGEYNALVAASVLSFEDAIQLVALRGRYMQEAVQPGVGAMAAIIGLDNAVIAAICAEITAEEIVAPANFNAIGQTVISGHAAAVDRACELAKAKGAKIAKRIPVSVPSHSPLMQSAADQFEAALAQVTFHSPKLPVLQNVDVKTHHDPNAIRQALVAQLTGAVRWVETIQEFKEHGVDTLIECGPGKVLAGLNKRIDKSMQVIHIGDVASFEANKQTQVIGEE